MKSILRVVLFNIVILVIGVLGIEVIWYFFYAQDIRFSVNVLADSDRYYDVSPLYQRDESFIHYTRDENGFRGPYSQVKDIDILVVGGSTTDQRYVDDKEEWCRVLENDLQADGVDITVVNAGVDGQSSFGHIKNFDLWFAKLESLRPKYILFYVGLNDFYKDENYSYDDLAQTSLFKSSFTYYVFRLVKGLAYAKTYRMGHHAYSVDGKTVVSEPLLSEGEYEPLMKRRLAAYLQRLKIVRQRALDLGATPIFVTQTKRVHWLEDGEVKGIDFRYGYDGVTYNGVDMHYMEKLLNRTALSICAGKTDTVCFDLATELEFNQTDFYDFAHNTPSGSAKIGHYLARKFNALD